MFGLDTDLAIPYWSVQMFGLDSDLVIPFYQFKGLD